METGQLPRHVNIPFPRKLVCLVFMKLLFLKASTHGSSTPTRHAVLGGSASTHCDGRMIQVPPGVDVKGLSIRKDNTDIYVFSALTFEMNPDYGDRWSVSQEGISSSGKNLVLDPEFRVTVQASGVVKTDAGLVTCRLSFASKNSNTIYKLDKKLIELRVHEYWESKHCKNKWMYYVDGDTCIKVFGYALTWEDARQTCLDNTGDLVVIESKDMDSYLSELTGLQPGTGYWIGLKKSGPKFEWVGDGRSSHFFWHKNRPPRSGACAQKGTPGNGEWTAADCSSESKFICQRATGAETTSWPLIKILEVLLLGLAVVAAHVVVAGSVWGYYFSKRARKAFHKIYHKFRRTGNRIVTRVKESGDSLDSQGPSTAAEEGFVVVLYDSELNEIVEASDDVNIVSTVV